MGPVLAIAAAVIGAVSLVRLISKNFSDKIELKSNDVKKSKTSISSGTLTKEDIEKIEHLLSKLPAWDIKETEKEFVVKVDLPGIDEKDISLTIRDGVLTLRGEKKSERKGEDENYYLMERSHGSFHRSILLPENVDQNKVAASFDKGVLTVTLPKRPQHLPESLHQRTKEGGGLP